MSNQLILVTGAAGRIGSVGFKVVKLLIEKGLPVRAMVRRIDDRSEALKNLGAEITVGDLTNLNDLHKAITDCKRIFFSMSVSDSYLEASLATIAVAKYHGVQLFVNLSQMSVSYMDINKTSESTQQKHHWLVEQALNWSGLPFVVIRPTIFLEHPFLTHFARESIQKSGKLRLPFGSGHTSPVATVDVARVASTILASSPETHLGKVYQLTGPKSLDGHQLAEAYAKALKRSVEYEDVPLEEWIEKDLKTKKFPTHLENQIATMAKLHRENRYNRYETNDIEQLTGRKPLSVEEWVEENQGYLVNKMDESNNFELLARK